MSFAIPPIVKLSERILVEIEQAVRRFARFHKYTFGSSLREELRLELKPDIRLRPLRSGIDFLGYVVYPTHTRVRQRVVKHAFAAVKAARASRRQSVLASYVGHFAHANAFRLTEKLQEASKSRSGST